MQPMDGTFRTTFVFGDRAVEKVLADSELRELWGDAGDLFADWQAAVNELLTRLKSISA